ncbi:Protein tilB [Rhizophlyctis rosea]|nr:Protein tilB [Rhizophlyctis rosea]
MVQKIDRDLLRKRAEHNDGDLSTLREITLHQFDIERIENLDTNCRHLEILFLQNNQISKIENLNKLKELQYLQLALNNITRIENLGGCESLRKLDLTVNFVDDPLDVDSLKGNENLRELYLVGNPCTQKEGYREFVITTLPQLKTLDGREIEKSERILAKQVYPAIRERFLAEREAKQQEQGVIQSEDTAEVAAPKDDSTAPDLPPPETDTASPKETDKEVVGGLAGTAPAVEPSEEIDETFPNPSHPPSRLEATRHRFQTQTVPHTPETRLQAARDIALMKEGHKRPAPSDPTKAYKISSQTPLVAPDGRILQKNEGKWFFAFAETPNTISLTVEISKFLDTSLIDVDVHPTYIRVTIKGKILQLVLDHEVKTDDVICERSKGSGDLVVTMVKVLSEVGGDVVTIRRKEREKGEREKKEREEARRAEEGRRNVRNRRYERLFEPSEAVDFRNIVGEGKGKGKGGLGGKAQIEVSKAVAVDDFEDDPDVPPLC